MNEQYKWNYDIKIKTKEGTFEYEQETLDKIDEILNKHPNYTELQATHNKSLVKKNVRPRNQNKT
ncbi:MAG: hypothetical protein J6S67_10690 [Methanobrevibacter sp.]|nr:hypothetical protein [Methanobrevibacter sp.]